MGIGVRSFLIDDDGRPKRVPWCRMLRLFQGAPTSHFNELAGRQVRCAIVFLEFFQRRPRRVLRTEFSVLYFDDNGGLDPDVQGQQLRLIGQCQNDSTPPAARNKVVDIRPRLAKRLYREKFEWTPTEDELETIIRGCL